MKCEKCGNEYPSSYYFTTPTICNDCYSKLSQEEKEQLVHTLHTKTDMELQYYRVGFGLRFAAVLIDSAIVLIVTILLMKFSGFLDSATEFSNSFMDLAQSDPGAAEAMQLQFITDNISFFLFSSIFTLLYFSLEIFVGASLGKILLSIQIANSDKTPAAYGKLALRYFTKHIASIISFVWVLTLIGFLNTLSSILFLVMIIGCFFALSQKKMALHDLIAKTAVYKKDDLYPENNK